MCADTNATLQRTWYRQMDGLRFIAVSAVLVEHFAFFIGQHLHAGFFGVDLFFVISGFLITEGLLMNKEQKMPGKKIISQFYIKRFLRIFPIYYLVLFIALFTYPPFTEIAPYAFTYTVNYYEAITGNSAPMAFSHFWSLSVEEQFYIFWPFIAVFFARRKSFLAAILVIMVASVVYFLVYQDYLMLQSRMYSLCFGALLAYIKMYYPDFYKQDTRRRFLYIVGIAVLASFIQLAFGLSFLSLGLVYLGSNESFRGPVAYVLEHKWSIFIGKISYGIYLYHKPIALILGAWFFDDLWSSIDFSFFPQLEYNSWIVKLPFYYGCAILVAFISYRLIESPLLRLKKRLK